MSDRWAEQQERQWERLRRASDYLLRRPLLWNLVVIGVLALLAGTVWLGFDQTRIAQRWLVIVGLVLMGLSTVMAFAYPVVTGKPADEVLVGSWAFAVGVGLGGWLLPLAWGTPKWVSVVALTLSALGLIGSTAMAVRARHRREE